MKSKILMLITLCFIGIGSALGQTITAKGVVVDENNEPVIGATVRLKSDATVGTQTGLDGDFTLRATQGELIIISYIGYTTQEVPASTNMQIKLVPDQELLDEVIVVAFGTSTKSSFTGSATQINAADIAKTQASNVTGALAGKVPGLTVTSGNHQPGTTSTVRIRGIGSFSAGSSPLYVVDGVPYDGDISSINPQDIESTTVLKDAASAALYGARGANGVILIQTKSGARSDRLSVTVEARYGVNQRGVGDYDVLKDPKQYAAKYFEGIYNHFMKTEGMTSDVAMEKAYDTYFSTDSKVANLVYHPFSGAPENTWFVRQPNGMFEMNPALTIGREIGTGDNKYWLQPDDWSKEVFSNNPRQEYNVALSGSSDKANYYMSIGYLNDKGYIIKSDFTRFTARLRGDYVPTKWLKVGGNLGYTRYTANDLSNTTEGGNSGNIFAVTNYIAPIYPVYVRGADKQIMKDKFGNTIYDFGTEEYPGLTRPYLSIANPIALYELDTQDRTASVISARGYADFTFYPGLKATLNIGYDHDDTYGLYKSNVYYGQFALSGGSIERWFSRTASINTQQLLTYVGNTGAHNYDFLIGHEFYKYQYNNLWGFKRNMYNPHNTEISGAIQEPNTSSSESKYATEGYLARAQYNYDNRYFISASFRRDASSRFHKDHRWGNFWSLGGSWLISRESFMSNIDWVNMLKLKASFGMQGNDAIGSFRYTDLYVVKNANEVLGTSFSSKGNENLTWETSANLNVGLEFDLFNNRLSGGIDFYTREVTDMLFWRNVPNSSGYNGYYDNIGAMRNTGVDFELSGVLVKTNDVNWTLSVNGGYFENTLTKLPEEWEAVEGGHRDGSAVYRVGGSIYDRAYPKYLGVDEQGRPTWQTYNKETGEYGSTTDNTVAREKDNRVIFTDVRPMLVGGINTLLSAYGIDFSISMSYALGGRMYDSTYASLMHGGTGSQAGTNWHKDILNSWTPENNTSDIPMVDYSGRYANSLSDRFLISRNYLALNNVTLGYTLPSEWTQDYGIQSLRIYFAGDNLALFSARKGLDPRFGSGVGYKAIRSISGGIKLTF